ncbi:MAG TPA: hypothetical protein PLR20_01880 [Syntrophales bacterium]|jgi:hypothetical protein|nr:hypothetical protein [Syntrophales bacterium]HPI57220.1 hypothetical protein [Syntrophales bacterium]HPN23396.1 hypothetical protein [Syntrophales bacterium]HQM28079.1 hypothetical protein [Syntrophales bacterium]
MSKDVIGKDTDSAVEKTNKGEVEVLEPMQKSTPFFSFRYSYREISSVNGRTQIRSKKRQFTNGKFESEDFEGTLGGHVYDHMVSDMQKYYLNYIDTFLKPFFALLPFGSKNSKK